jgi:hypothetical protein
MKGKPNPKAEGIEEIPDAWERFDTVMQTKPKPATAKKKSAPSGKRGGSKPV